MKEKKQFGAKINKILNLVINSVYTNKEIFLREIISNSSDACEKLRYEKTFNRSIKCSPDNCLIAISVNRAQHTISISDNGIGMNKQDLIDNLGVIAKSGTENFLNKMQDQKNNPKLIGHFGIGFYSVFMVSDEVTVISKKVGDTDSFFWYSDGKNGYSVGKYNKKTEFGTKIILKIKVSEERFLDSGIIKSNVMMYSNHIPWPIKLIDSTGVESYINVKQALWTFNPKDISDSEYHNFYNNVINMQGTPWLVVHNKIEGIIEYTNLLFIPEKRNNAFLSNKNSSIKLYNNRVLVSKNYKGLVPDYLRFVIGIVDSKDLKLNMNREIVQNNRMVNIMKRSLTRKLLESLKSHLEKNSHEYDNFTNNFGDIIKEGLYNNLVEHEKEIILDISKFYSTKINKMTTLNGYLSRMKEGQKEIYILNGNSIESMKKSPQLEIFRKRNIEVLLLKDYIDNFWINSTYHYKNVFFKSICNHNIDLKDKNEVKTDTVHLNNSLIKFIKLVLKEKVFDVVVSRKLTSSPSCISISGGNVNIRMEKILLHQDKNYPRIKKIFEINPNHVILQKISKHLEEKNKQSICSEIIKILYNQSILVEGGDIDHPQQFSDSLNKIMSLIQI